MPYIAINLCDGKFKLSEVALEYLATKKNVANKVLYTHDLKRDDPDLIDMILTFQDGMLGFPINTPLSDIGLCKISEDAYCLDAWKVHEICGAEIVRVDTSLINLHHEKIKLREVEKGTTVEAEK